jgi:hypothetical protein
MFRNYCGIIAETFRNNSETFRNNSETSLTRDHFSVIPTNIEVFDQ